MHFGRRLWSHFRFRFGLNWRLARDIAFALLGILLVFLGGHSLLEIIGGALTLASAIFFVMDLKEKWRSGKNTRVTENEDFAELVRTSALPAGFALHFGVAGGDAPLALMGVKGARPYLISDAVNRLLDRAANPIHRAAEQYEVPDTLKDHRQRAVNLKRPHFNDPKVRLRTDITEEALTNGRLIELGPTDYFSSAATNEMACDQFERAEKDRLGRPALLFAVSDMVIDRGAFVSLAESKLSNHIGVSTLVLTADHQIAIQDQGNQSVSANETAVGASGSVDIGDLDAIGGGSLQALLRFAMEREAREELSAQFAHTGEDTVLTGYARYVARGGKPEFFGISRSVSVLSALRATADDRKYVDGIRGRPFAPSVAGLVDEIDALLAEGASRRSYSLSMVVCLRTARDRLVEMDAGALGRLGLG